MKNNIIEVQNVKVNVTNINDNDYICISDFTKIKEGKSTSDDIIRNWLRNRLTLEFLGTWESIYNPNFNSVEFDGFRKNAGLHTFTLSVSQWCEKTNAIGIYSKRGKYGGTYAHKDIAFEFASAISPVFKLYLIKEFERLKELENKNREWDVKRLLTKNNYPFNPGTFVMALNNVYGFNGANLQYGAISKVVPEFVYQDKISLRNKSKSEKLSIIKSYYESGYYLAAEVAGATESSQHWVAVDKVVGDRIFMLDPGSEAVDMWNQYDYINTTQFVYFKVNKYLNN